LRKVEANLEHLKPCDVIMPVNAMYATEEWQEIYAAQKPSPEYSPNFKQVLNHNKVTKCVTYLRRVHEKFNCSNDQTGLVMIEYFNVCCDMELSVAVSKYVNL